MELSRMLPGSLTSYMRHTNLVSQVKLHRRGSVQNFDRVCKNRMYRYPHLACLLIVHRALRKQLGPVCEALLLVFRQ